MLNSIAVLSVLVSTAWAQNSLIPPGISPGCSTFLTQLNGDTSLGACINPLVQATSAYSPLAPAGTTHTAAAMTSALNSMCSASSTACSSEVVRKQLGAFYAACRDELTTAANKDVIRNYDVLFALIPLKEAVCSKDDDGKFCVTETKATGGPANAATNIAVSPDDIGKYIAISTPTHTKRGPDDQVALAPNATTINNNNLLFFFLTGDLPAAKLCTTCTKNVLSAYITFEEEIPYAPGFANSVLLGGQTALYKGVTSTCPAGFLGGAVQAAGGISSDTTFGAHSGAASSRHLGFAGVVAAVAAVVASIF